LDRVLALVDMFVECGRTESRLESLSGSSVSAIQLTKQVGEH